MPVPSELVASPLPADRMPYPMPCILIGPPPPPPPSLSVMRWGGAFLVQIPILTTNCTLCGPKKGMGSPLCTALLHASLRCDYVQTIPGIWGGGGGIKLLEVFSQGRGHLQTVSVNELGVLRRPRRGCHGKAMEINPSSAIDLLSSLGSGAPQQCTRDGVAERLA